MANLDITELLSDPDLADQFTVIRIVETVDSHGRLVQNATRINDVWGVVQPASAQALRLVPEGVNVAGALIVVSTFQFVIKVPGYQPDRIIWRGVQYQATARDPFDNYGAGHNEVVFTLLAMTQQSAILGVTPDQALSPDGNTPFGQGRT